VIIFIDIGGTPANILKDNKLAIAKANGLLLDNLVIILDPFDLARAERKIELGAYKTRAIKFPIDVPESEVDLDSENVSPPSPEECKELFENVEAAVIGKIQSIYGRKIRIEKIKERYSKLKENIEVLARDSNNLRNFMNGLIKLLSFGLKTIKLEDILSQNSEIVYNILEKMDIPSRAVCPSCNNFVRLSLRGKTPCCNIPADEIIKTGRYIPQNGFLPVITYLCGYCTYSNSQEKMQQAAEILKNMGKNGNPIINYAKIEEKTMFESYLLGDEK
jgi:hypothetical protein